MKDDEKKHTNARRGYSHPKDGRWIFRYMEAGRERVPVAKLATHAIAAPGNSFDAVQSKSGKSSYRGVHVKIFWEVNEGKGRNAPESR